jgi:two-component system nitrogen regulation response regulator GlnG
VTSPGDRSPLDITTLRRGATPVAAESAPVLTLTILWHPDPARIGDVAFLDGLGAGGAGLSRLEPELAPPRGGRPAPLTDPHLSRTPIRLRPTGDGVRLIPPAGGTDCVVDGAPLDGPRLVTSAAIARGAVLLLGDRVALLLHRRRRPTAVPALGLVGDSDALDQVRADVTRVADLDRPVLVRGPTGAGKELVARAIHAAGPRAREPFVAINLATVPATLAGAALFGHARGAFTGASAAHDGLVVQASGGTLFLDEIGEATVEVQAMLLRALESGEVQPLGEAAPRPVDVRWIAATDADLEARGRDGRFREPLRHRLAGFELAVPSLDDRRDDLGRLARHFAAEALTATGEPAPLLSAPLVATLALRRWPGNVRELRNVIHQLVVSNRGRAAIELDERAAALLAGPAPTEAQPADASRDPARLIEALRAHRWQIGTTAAALGVSRTTLYAWMERSPDLRKARDIPRDELVACLDAHGGDVDAAAARLEVSPRGLRLRMKELGVSMS